MREGNSEEGPPTFQNRQKKSSGPRGFKSQINQSHSIFNRFANGLSGIRNRDKHTILKNRKKSLDLNLLSANIPAKVANTMIQIGKP